MIKAIALIRSGRWHEDASVPAAQVYTEKCRLWNKEYSLCSINIVANMRKAQQDLAHALPTISFLLFGANGQARWPICL